ncbi:hypothetical protein K9L67_03840 [Candidatus Woesearchaeota archaeon]|nr:hypothetical protein [Candidatus Woesearchaeota archaeon]MCF7901334.1 hypothetical protein [Candidatus Woesearchaeota archaeon]
MIEKRKKELADFLQLDLAIYNKPITNIAYRLELKKLYKNNNPQFEKLLIEYVNEMNLTKNNLNKIKKTQKIKEKLIRTYEKSSNTKDGPSEAIHELLYLQPAKFIYSKITHKLKYFMKL